MARGSRDLLQLLANPTNRTLLSVLALEPQYPRRLAELVGLTEHEASRRLRTFERLGLAEGSWTNVGKTVRMYRLSASKFEVTLGENGLAVTGLGTKDKVVDLGPAAERPPLVPDFVGRDQELAQLRALLAERRAVVVQGIGGVGKTALAAALAAAWGRPVLWHTVSPGESGPVLLARLAANARALETPAHAQRYIGLSASEDATLLLGAVGETIERLGALAILDRFEHAGDGAGDVAAELARRLSGGRMLVTTRSWPRELPRDQVGTFALGGLSRADAEELLLRFRLSGATARTLYGRTGGHPLALRLLAVAGKAPVSGQAAPFEESALRDYLLNDVLPQLGDAEREALLALSVLRAPFLASEAEAVATTKGTLVALAKLEARGLALRSGDLFAVHDLVRAFAVDAVPERKQVHARAAKALLASGEALKALEALHHMLEAGQVEKALDLVRREALEGTYRFADLGLLAPYRDALGRLAASPKVHGAARAAVEIELGVLDFLTGESETARRHLASAAGWLGPREPLRPAHALAMGRLDASDGRPAEALVHLREAERLATAAGDDRILLDALLNQGFVEESQGKPPALDLYQRAVEVGRRSSDLRALSAAAAGVARLMVLTGQPGAESMGREALRLAQLAGYPRGEAAAYMTLINHAQMTGQRAVAPELSERYLEIAERLGDPFLRTCALTDTAYFLALDGRAEEALRRARLGMEVARSIKSELFAASGAYAAALALVKLGRAAEGIETLRPFVEPLHPELARWPAVAAIAYEVLAQAKAASGDAPGARDAERTAASFRAQVGTSREVLAPRVAAAAAPRKTKRRGTRRPRGRAAR